MANPAYSALLLLLTLCAASAANGAMIGGASSFKSTGADVIASWNARAGADPIAAYDSVGSGAGVDGFNAGTYAVGVSDDPMTAAQEASVPAGGKLTVPLTVATYSFFVHGPSVAMTAAEVYKVYSGAYTKWEQVPSLKKTSLKGAITRVARSDKSGTTAIVQQLFTAAKTGYSGATSGVAFTYAGLVPAASTSEMCAAISATKGAIGYATTGGCTQAAGVLVEVKLKNKAGKAVNSATWSAAAAITGKPPAPQVSWSKVTFVWQNGPKTPPMVSMQFGFIRRTLTGVTQGATAKSFLVWAMSGGANCPMATASKKYKFYPVPATWLTPSLNAVKAL